MKATIGRIVHYTLSEENAKQINRQGAGNHHYAGMVVPAIVVWPHDNEPQTFNGQAFLDGNDTLWLTSVPYDDSGKPGTWQWPAMTSELKV